MNHKLKIKDVISGMLLISGTTIGAGMLGIPLITSQTGIIPAIVITAIVWIFMFLTGLLFLEVTMWMHKGSNVVSMSKRFLGTKGKILSSGTFAFLYYCLMVAYFAAGAPILMKALHLNISGWHSHAIFGIFFGLIVGLGLKCVDRVNYILMIGLVLSYFGLMGTGYSEIDVIRYQFTNWKGLWFAAPILFTAFGYHNVVPSLYSHFKENGKVMRYSIFFGTLIPFVIYVFWQWVIIGSVPMESIKLALDKGLTITQVLQEYTGKTSVKTFSQLFSLFAIITSMMGVSFSMVDFLGDGLELKRKGFHRFLLCLLTFIPPFIITSIDPSIFVLAIGIAGGFGEAFLNGIMPAWMVWKGRYNKKLKSEYLLPGGRLTLSIILFLSFIVMVLETIILIYP